MEQQKWGDLGFKDKAAYCTAIASFILGWIMVFFGMILAPMGEVDGTVITCFGIALSYCGGVFGVAMYIKSSKSEVFNDVMSKVNQAIADKFERDEYRG